MLHGNANTTKMVVYKLVRKEGDKLISLFNHSFVSEYEIDKTTVARGNTFLFSFRKYEHASNFKERLFGADYEDYAIIECEIPNDGDLIEVVVVEDYPYLRRELPRLELMDEINDWNIINVWRRFERARKYSRVGRVASVRDGICKNFILSKKVIPTRMILDYGKIN